ncbi:MULTISPECIES: YheC/YheD family protein [Paenibacillus]|uniref:YheC/YheD family protein n=1 Tax=Paenibacillus TaxID=44249 RepID=UPI00087FE58A|nr:MULTISPECIES: YheC/YheD family protein [Paenibacillus]GCL73778.1 hypothetical protein PN4B1_37200 [Paenibacillus naphthalenovorans]SDI54114.1 YheC/D like ATP-grasp [Paenibacillus naphthalenovorans]
MKRAIRRVSNKLTKTRVLRGNKSLRRRILATRRMDRDALYAMLQKYTMVYIKPCNGSQGKGVIRVERIPESGGNDSQDSIDVIDRKKRIKYRYQTGVRVHQFTNYRKTYRAILKETRGRPYLVQKGVRLLVHAGRPFDVRVMVQRNPKGRWKATGIVGRVAHPRKVVTNGSQGGTIYPVEVLLKVYTGKEKRKALMSKMKKIGVKAARQLSAAYPGMREIGADIALDRRLKPWIIEVNTNPDPCPFTKLKNRSMIRRIIRYAKGYGRTYKLRCTKSKQGVV